MISTQKVTLGSKRLLTPGLHTSNSEFYHAAKVKEHQKMCEHSFDIFIGVRKDLAVTELPTLRDVLRKVWQMYYLTIR